ncbi:MAG: tetratricopeptide repeat protein [Geobacteraceae bacterium]|nr:tetratricopeptide repeat protein [Geobacteraceae bacterium]
MKKVNVVCLIAVVAVGALLLSAGTVRAMRMRPPLPFDCTAAEKTADPKTKVSLYTRCLEDGAFYADYQRNEVYFYRGNALFELGLYAEALADYDRFIRATGGHVWALHQRGMTHRALGQYTLALADFDKALASNADATAVLFDRGQLLADMGQYEKALKDLRRADALATEYYPTEASAANALAWLLATCPDPNIRDGREAVSLALKAVRIDKNAENLDTLAAAQARNGDFTSAVETQQAVLDLLRKDQAEQATIEEYLPRLSLYKEGKPYTALRDHKQCQSIMEDSQ